MGIGRQLQMNGWRAKGTKTRRNWWDVLAGCKDGNPRIIGGISFPVLSAAQIRNGMPVTVDAICRNENEKIPQKMTSGRWISE
jgi:hypothetical protein